MNTTLLIIIGTITISLLGHTQYADAICMENQDWPDAPCYGCINCYPGLDQEKLDWAPYYDYKGSTWMDTKKHQLETAIKNNALREWFEQDKNGAHKNVHQYYFLQGEVPNIYGKSFDEALGFEIAWNAVKDSSPDAPLLLWNYHDVILDGTLIETDLAVTITGDHVPLYHINVDKYFKGEKRSDMVAAVENPDDLEFDLFENGLFYLKKLESQNLYTATIASAKTFGNCDARDLIEISPVLPTEKPARSAPILPEGFVDPCVPEYFDVDPDGMVFENDRVPEPEQNSPIPENCGHGTLLEEGICVEAVNSITSSGQWETVQSVEQKPVSDVIPSPVKQMKMGIKLGHVICDQDKSPVWNTHYKPACVYPDTESELIKRGWAKLRLMLPASPYPEKEMDWTGRNVMSMMLDGTFSYSSTPVETPDEKRNAVEEYSKQYHQGEQYLEYAITPYQYHYNVGDKVQFELLEWGKTSDCSNLTLRIIGINDQSVFEHIPITGCVNTDVPHVIFNSYSMGDYFEEFICDKSGYYRIEVSNGGIFSPSILQNFACLESELRPTGVTPEPQPVSELNSEIKTNLNNAEKLLKTAYYENVNLGPLKINDVIVGFGIENNRLIIDVLYRYSTSSEMDIVKKKIRDIVGDEIEIEYIPYKEPSRFIEKALTYHWNEHLRKNNIEFTPAISGYSINDDGIGDGTFLCSPLVAPNGTEFYIVSTIIVEPFLITDTFIDIEKPEFCKKSWKTDVILVEPDRVVSLWLEMGQGKISN